MIIKVRYQVFFQIDGEVIYKFIFREKKKIKKIKTVYLVFLES